MCGIVAIIALEQRRAKEVTTSQYRAETEEQLVKSLATISHRGPDAQGTWISRDNRVALGHVRLSIKDLSPAGQQPLHSSDNSVHAIVNGEIYDYEKLRAELAPEYEFQSRSDSELIIALYQRYGISLFSHLRGEFSFVLYDEQRQFLLCARDRFGVKPLFWTIREGRLLIASEAKALRPLGVRLEWDVKSLIAEGWLGDQRTIFKGVRKILPGNYMTCDSFDYLAEHTYWESVYPDKYSKDTRTEQEVVEQLRERLYYAVQTRMQADVPVGVYLSGGIDSSTVAGIACDILASRGKKVNGHATVGETAPLTCFTVAFDDNSGFNEFPIAERTAKFLNVPLHTQVMDEQAFADNFEAATVFMEQNNFDLNYIGKYLLSKKVQELGVKVVLTGEGSDEHLGGYPWLYPAYICEPDLTHGIDPLTPSERAQRTHETKENAMISVPGAPKPNPSTRVRATLNDTHLPWVFFKAPFATWTQSHYGMIDVKESQATLSGAKQLEKIQKSWHPFHSASYIWIRSILANFHLTTLGDRMEMAHSIEGRPPFLDHDLTNFLNHIPPSIKIHYDAERHTFREKWPLYEAAKPFVSREMYERKKKPFMAPYRMKPGGPIHRMLVRVCTRENLEGLGFVDVEGCLEMLRRAFEPDGPPQAIRSCYAMAQWVALSKAFDMPRAGPEES